MPEDRSTTSDDRNVATESTATDGESATAESDSEVPPDVVEAAERLTRLAREAVVEAERTAYLDERAERLADHGFVARVREEDDTLVLHPEEWIEDGTARPSMIEDTDRAVEVSLSGPGDPDEWAGVERHNSDIVEAVRSEYGDVHAANARAFADFMGNHYARRVETASSSEIREFLTEYFPRNAWPSADQREAVETSIDHVFAAAGSDPPEF